MTKDELIELVKPFASSSACEQNDVCEFKDCQTCNAECIITNLLANGVVVPPCNLGDIMYKVSYSGKIVPLKIIGFDYSAITSPYNSIPFENFGKNVFKDRNEAKRFRKRKNNEK